VPDLLLRIRFCESTNNYTAANDYSTARGAYQFLIGSWEYYGHAERTGAAEAHRAQPAEQDEAALATLLRDGTRPWAASRDCWADPNLPDNYATAVPRQGTPPGGTIPAAPAAADPTTTTAAPTTTTTTTAPTTTTTAPAETTTTAPAETTTTTTVEVATSTPGEDTTTSAPPTTTDGETTTTVIAN
jgi:hypothetical protein